MLNQLKTYLEYGNYFCGVEHASQDDQEKLYATVLKKKRNKIDVQSFLEEDSFSNLITKLRKKQPVFLIINNDNVLTKQIESEQIEVAKLVYNAFPNINLDDFFYEVFSKEKNHFVSICRKIYIEELISEYKKKEVSIIDISLGNSIVSSIISYLDSKDILTSNSLISIENKIISSIEKKETNETIKYDVNGLTVSNYHLLSLSGALNSILEHFHSITNFDILKQSLNNGFRQLRFYTQFLKFGLVFLLGILLVNFFVFNHYFNKVNTLQQTSQINQTTKQKILELNINVGKSQKMVEDMLKSNSSKSSFYVNAIIQLLPSSVLLSELNYQPVLKRIRDGQPIEINNNTILISGESNNSILFSNFINDLETLTWVKKVEVLNYEDASTTVSNFSIKLNMTHDHQN